MGRLKFLLFLLLVSIALFVITDSSTKFREALHTHFPEIAARWEQATAVKTEDAAPSGDFAEEFSKQIRLFTQKFSSFTATPAPKPLPAEKKPALPPPPPDPSVMHIVMEDLRPPLNNEFVGPEISAELDFFLHLRRETNAQLVNEVGSLFGENAKKEVVRVLLDDEIDSERNAQTCKTPLEFATRQEEIDLRTEEKLLQAYRRNRKDIGHVKPTVSPAWKAFFKRVKSYQQVAQQPAS